MKDIRLVCTVLLDEETNELIVRQPDDLEMRLKIPFYTAEDFDAKAVWYALFHEY